MIKFFRKFRQDLLMENKTGKYLKYAIGEILLVVIGILIALSINNWQQDRTNQQLEYRYITNMISELKRDSVRLESLYQQLLNKDRIKYVYLDMLKNNQKDDSLKAYFGYQWDPVRPYVPSRSTFTEMISNAHLGLVKPNNLREHIVETYTNYIDFTSRESDQFEEGLLLIEALRLRVPDLIDPTIVDILNLKDDFYIINRMTLNGSRTRSEDYRKMLKESNDLLQQLKVYQATLE